MINSLFADLSIEQQEAIIGGYHQHRRCEFAPSINIRHLTINLYIYNILISNYQNNSIFQIIIGNSIGTGNSLTGSSL
jgi:hypothetical protein